MLILLSYRNCVVKNCMLHYLCRQKPNGEMVVQNTVISCIFRWFIRIHYRWLGVYFFLYFYPHNDNVGVYKRKRKSKRFQANKILYCNARERINYKSVLWSYRIMQFCKLKFKCIITVEVNNWRLSFHRFEISKYCREFGHLSQYFNIFFLINVSIELSREIDHLQVFDDRPKISQRPHRVRSVYFPAHYIIKPRRRRISRPSNPSSFRFPHVLHGGSI